MKKAPAGKSKSKPDKPTSEAVSSKVTNDSIFGYMAGKAKIVGDTISPVCAVEDWDALK